MIFMVLFAVFFSSLMAAPNTDSVEIPGKGISYLYPVPPSPDPHPLEKVFSKFEQKVAIHTFWISNSDIQKKSGKEPVKAWFITPAAEFGKSEFLASLQDIDSIDPEDIALRSEIVEYYNSAQEEMEIDWIGRRIDCGNVTWLNRIYLSETNSDWPKHPIFQR